jgi:hypothetical protein
MNFLVDDRTRVNDAWQSANFVQAARHGWLIGARPPGGRRQYAAGKTGAAASPEVLASAQQTSGRAASLRADADRFLANIRAAYARAMQAGLIRARSQRDTRCVS